MGDTHNDKRSSCQTFLSYARADKENVESLYNKLDEAGYKPWMDKEDIHPGEKWKRKIKKAISNSDFFIVCLTKNSYEKRGYLQREIKQALDIWQEKLEDDIYLIPARLEECDVHNDLQDFQWVNLYEDDGWDRLCRAIQAGIRQRQTKGNKKEQRNVKDTHPSHQIPEEGDSKKPFQKIKRI